MKPQTSDPPPSILITVVSTQPQNGPDKTSDPARDGQPGRDGKDGSPGRDGKDGEPGRDGKDGAPGRDGKDGNPGRDGKDGAPGRDGKDGNPGRDGRDGDPSRDRNAQPVAASRDGKDGRDGKNGRDGRDGNDGKDGKPGRDGKDGRDSQAKCAPLTIKEDCPTASTACPKLTASPTPCATPTSTEPLTSTETTKQRKSPQTDEEDPSQMSDPNLLAVVALAAGILGFGFFVILNILRSDQEKPLNAWGERLGQYTLQILGLTFILPTILIIAVATNLKPEAVTALLGSIIGYIFGSARSADPAPPPAPAKAQPERNTTPQESSAAQAVPVPENSTAAPHVPPADAAPRSS
ncbi:hypothetical protein [Bradyrhizobium sp. USDA 3650]